MNIAMPSGLGAVLAVIILVLAIVLCILGKLPLLLAALIGGLALARLT